MKDNNLNLFNKIIIATVLLLIIVVIYVSRQEPEDKGAEVTETTVAPKVESEDEPQYIDPPTVVKAMKPKVAAELYKRSIGFNNARLNSIFKDKQIIHDFKNKVKLDIKLPANMRFVNMDMEDDIAGLYGKSHDGKKQMTILAREGKVKTEDVVDYLKDATKAMPMLKGHEFQADKITTMKSPENSGLNEIKIIPTTDSGGKAAYGALIERSDGKGTYLFMMEAPRDFFDNSEGSLDLMLESVKVR